MAMRGRDPVLGAMEEALSPGSFVGWRDSSAFVAALEDVKGQIDALVDEGGAPARAVDLYELFIAACHEKAEEVDDSDGGFGTFVGSLFLGWIRARQSAGAPPDETAATLLSWIDEDDFGFCNRLEESAVEALDRKGLSAYECAVRREWLDSGSGKGNEADFRRRQAFNALRSIYAMRGDVAGYEEVCEEAGALEPADCQKLAEICMRRRRPEDALAWIERGLSIEESGARPRRSAWGLPGMKRKVLKKLGRGEEALSSSWEAYCRRPTTYSYEDLMEFVPKADRGEWRRKALDIVDGAGLIERIPLLVKLKEWGRLSDLVQETSREDLMSLSHYTTQPAAENLGRKHPAAAAKLHVALGLRILVAKKSKYYDAALGHIEKARAFLLETSLGDEWEKLVTEIRSEHSRKSAFMPGFERIVEGRREPTFMDRVRERRDRGPGRRRRS